MFVWLRMAVNLSRFSWGESVLSRKTACLCCMSETKIGSTCDFWASVRLSILAMPSMFGPRIMICGAAFVWPAGFAAEALVDSWAHNVPPASRPPTATIVNKVVFVNVIIFSFWLYSISRTGNKRRDMSKLDAFDNQKLPSAQHLFRGLNCLFNICRRMGRRDKARLELGGGQINALFQHAVKILREPYPVTF